MAFSRKSSPTSLADLDRPEARAARSQTSRRAGRGRRRTVAILVPVLIAAGAAATWQLTSGGGSWRSGDGAHSVLAGGATSAPASPAGPVRSGSAGPSPSSSGAHIGIVIDGWSWRTLASTPVTADAGTGSPANVPFQAGTANDLAELMRTSPALVTQLLARLVSDDTSLKCTPAGCSDSRGSVDPGVLLHPGSIAGLGDEYRAYDITSGFYAASVDTGGSDAVSLAASGYTPVSVAGRPAGSKDDMGVTLTPNAGNGFLQARYLIAAGLGRLFTPQARWLGSNQADPTRYDGGNPISPSASAAQQLLGQRPQVIALGGLTTALPAAAGWTDSHLTYATSPTTGCGPEAICVPTSVSPTVARDTISTAMVCDPTGKQSGVLVLQDAQVSLTLPGATRQYGLGGAQVWGAGSTVSGQQQFRIAAAALFNGYQLTERLAGGRVDAGSLAPATIAQALAGVRFDGAHWHSC